VFDAEGLAGVAEGPACVAFGVVGHNAADGDAERFVIGDSGVEEGDGFFFGRTPNRRACAGWSCRL
jgi:hypothetical protein